MTDSTGKTKKHSLQYVGSRYKYRLEVPMTKPGTMELIFNFYPDSGSPTIISAKPTIHSIYSGGCKKRTPGGALLSGLGGDFKRRIGVLLLEET
jgi:hypothetical protein